MNSINLQGPTNPEGPIQAPTTITTGSSRYLINNGHLVLSYYVERFWTPQLGPTAIVLLRQIATTTGQRTNSSLAVDLGNLAVSVGLGRSTRRLRKVLRRLEERRIIAPVSGGYRFPTHLPGLSTHQLQRLTPDLANEHSAIQLNSEATP